MAEMKRCIAVLINEEGMRNNWYLRYSKER